MSLAKKSKAHNKPGSANKTCFPAFQKPNSKNLRAAFWRRMAYLQFETKTGEED